jgi:hypothetical protein
LRSTFGRGAEEGGARIHRDWSVSGDALDNEVDRRYERPLIEDARWRRTFRPSGQGRAIGSMHEK